MKELENKIKELKYLGYSTIALDITNLNKKDLEILIGRPIFNETKYLVCTAKYVIERMHQVENLDDEITVDYIIKLK